MVKYIVLIIKDASFALNNTLFLMANSVIHARNKNSGIELKNNANHVISELHLIKIQIDALVMPKHLFKQLKVAFLANPQNFLIKLLNFVKIV